MQADKSQFDVIIIGTGLTQSILAALLGLDKSKRILLLDREINIGGAYRTLPLDKFKQAYNINQQPQSSLLNQMKGGPYQWRLGFMNKVVLGADRLTKLILKCHCSEYLDWKCLDASFCFKYRRAPLQQEICKSGLLMFQVPASREQGMFTDVSSVYQKKLVHRYFINAIKKYDKGEKFSDKVTIRQSILAGEMNLKTQRFISHAIGLYPDEKGDNYSEREFVERLMLYRQSMLTDFGCTPYILPEYGFGQICEAMCWKVAVSPLGAVQMNKEIEKILLQEGQTGKVCVVGVVTADQYEYRAPTVICDPSYILKAGVKTQVIQKYSIIRCACLINHKFIDSDLQQFLEDEETGFESGLIIFPYDLFHRQTSNPNEIILDIYLTFTSHQHKTAPQRNQKDGDFHFVVNISAIRQNKDIPPQLELEQVLKRLKLNQKDFLEVRIVQSYKARESDGQQRNDKDFIYLDPHFKQRQQKIEKHFQSKYERQKQILRRRQNSNREAEIEANRIVALRHRKREQQPNKYETLNLYNFVDYNQAQTYFQIGSDISDDSYHSSEEGADQPYERQLLTLEDFIPRHKAYEEEISQQAYGKLPPIYNKSYAPIRMKQPKQLLPNEPNFVNINGLFVTDSPSYLPHLQKQLDNALHIYHKMTGRDISEQLKKM